MTQRDCITVLHFSDLQFGRRHRFAKMDISKLPCPFDTLRERTVQDLEHLKTKWGLNPDLVCITGDLAESGRKSEYAEVLDFISGIQQQTNLPNDRVVITPGNHDINRMACKAYFNECCANEVAPIEPYFPKWNHYIKFAAEFYRDVPGFVFSPEEPWSFFEITDLKLVVAGLNSTIKESHLDKDHFGFVGECQLTWFAKKLNEYKEKGWLRIAAIHHGLDKSSKAEHSILHDVKGFKKILGNKINIILHGHPHQSALGWIKQKIPISSAGNAWGLAKERNEESPNQYNILKIHPDRIIYYGRQFSGTFAKWIADPRINIGSDDGVDTQPVSFMKAEETFSEIIAKNNENNACTKHADFERDTWQLGDHTPRSNRGSELAQRNDDFLSRVAKVCELRHPTGTVEVEVKRWPEPQVEYLRVSIKSDNLEVYPVGGTEGDVSEELLEQFMGTVDANYRRSDNRLYSYFVYGGNPADETMVKDAHRRGVGLLSFLEFQRLIDFRKYVSRQNADLEQNTIYPPKLYVTQKCRIQAGTKKGLQEDALSAVDDLITSPMGRFVLILGDFGTGKTFLMRELARRIGTRNGPLIPLLMPMRDLDKSQSLYAYVAQHLIQAGEERYDAKAFRYMLEEGRVVLLIDGFDELALRVSYDRATEHLDTLIQAANGAAKIVVTSRTAHFQSDEQINTALGKRLETIANRRVLCLEPFDDKQIREFLINNFEDKAKADAYFELIKDIKDLLGLSKNPRMLSFITNIDEEKLREAKKEKGEISSAELYRLLLEQWLVHEYDRVQPEGALPMVTVEQRWKAVTKLAKKLWKQTEQTIDVNTLSNEVGSALQNIADKDLSRAQLAHQVGSGTLLIRDKDGNFSFVHQSVLEWLIARHAAEGLDKDGTNILGHRKISELMADFFVGLAGREKAKKWANDTLANSPSKTSQKNALLILERILE